MRTVSQVELKRLKKKGKVRLKSGAKEPSGSVVPAKKEMSGPTETEQPTLISVMGRMAEILDRMDKRSETANPDRTAALRSGPEPGAAAIESETIDVPDLDWSDISASPADANFFIQLPSTTEPVIEPGQQITGTTKKRLEIEGGWQQKVIRDKNGHLSKVEMSAPGTDVRYIFHPERAKNGVLKGVVMDVVNAEGQSSTGKLTVNRDDDGLISGLSMEKVNE